MQPEINVLGLSIKTFGLFFALNFVAWGALVGRRLRELGKPVDWAYEMVAAALAGGLIGARGYWLVQNHESFSAGSVLGGSGLIWYGGLLGGVVFVLVWARWWAGACASSASQSTGPTRWSRRRSSEG